MPRTSPVEAVSCEVRCFHPEDVAFTREGLAPDRAYQRVAELFGALADPTRAKILDALLRQELCTCDLAAVVGISESGTSQHLRVLRALRLVKSRRAGKFIYYSLDDLHTAQLVTVGMSYYQQEQAEHAPQIQQSDDRAS